MRSWWLRMARTAGRTKASPWPSQSLTSLCFLHRWAPGQWQYLWQWCGDVLPQTQLYGVFTWRQLNAVSEQNAPQLRAGRTYRRQNLACSFPHCVNQSLKCYCIHPKEEGRVSPKVLEGDRPTGPFLISSKASWIRLPFLVLKWLSCPKQMVSRDHSTRLWLGYGGLSFSSCYWISLALCHCCCPSAGFLLSLKGVTVSTWCPF